MKEKKANYDSIGESYENYIENSALRILDARFVLDMVGDVNGKSILDLACGYGYFSRKLYKRGASKVVGIDISEKMIELAKAKLKQYGDGLEFHVRDVGKMESFGKFDLVTAIWLFNYAASVEELETMFQTAARHLKPSGKLVAYMTSPDYRLEISNFDRYGIHIVNKESWKGGFRYQAEFLSTPPSPFTFYQWSRESYEQAIKKAGFSKFEWKEANLLESEIESQPEGFWDIFQHNNLNTGIICYY